MKPYEGKLASTETLKLTIHIPFIFGVANCTILARINAISCLRALLGLTILYVVGCERDIAHDSTWTPSSDRHL